jgi:hypothetical protein
MPSPTILRAGSHAESEPSVCGLCGILGDDSHWADGLTGPEVARASAVPWLRRRARRERIVLGNVVLAHYGLLLADWQGREFVLRSRTGATVLASTLGDLWPKAEQLAGREIDPLDPALLDRLDAATG